VTTRTVIGTLHHPIGGAVWVGADLAFTLLTPFGAGSSSYPGETTTVVTDGSGAFSTALAVPDTDAARYRVAISDTGVRETAFEFSLATGSTVDLATLLAASMATADPNSLQALIDTHAALVASSSVLGHVKVGSALAISSGTLSGIPATIPVRAAYSTQSWTSMPAALTEFNGNTQGRIKVDLTNATQARLVVHMMSTAGAASAELRAQYSTDASVWNYLDGATGPAAAINVASTTVAGAWVNLVAGAKADVFLRVVGMNGDGIISPSFGSISVQVK
jgi:hypothetical protein